MRILVTFFILICFIGASVGSGISENNSEFEHSKDRNDIMSSEFLVEDELDQYNYVFTGRAYAIYFMDDDHFQWLAQSFKPTMSTLTKVKLFLGQTAIIGIMPCDLIVSIRRDIDGDDLVSGSISSEVIPEEPVYEWLEFDFPDISVDIGETYYIVAKCYCGDYPQQNYGWASSNWSAYDNGESWYKQNYEEWIIDLRFDHCFETYGFGRVNLEILDITGGFRASSEIKNNGTGVATNVNWSIDLEGGFILIGGHSDGTISELAPGESETIRLSSLFGVGNTVITVTAGDTSKQASGFMLGPLVLNVQDI